MPTLTADTEVSSGSPLVRLRFFSHATASASATYPPVTAAVRVPPSAWSTSQSMTMVFSPSALESTQARSERPTRRDISWVRPPRRPLTDSRSPRVLVALGSIAYSAVTQPRPLPRRQRGTSSVTLAAHSTLVRPNSTSTDPSAWSSQPRVSFTGRSSVTDRPAGRDMTHSLSGPRRPEHQAGGGQRQRTPVSLRRLGQRPVPVVPRHQVGEHQLPDPGPGRVLGRLPRGQVQVRLVTRPVKERRLAQQQIGPLGQPDQGVGLPRVGRVGQPPARVLHPEAERLHRVVHVIGGDPERPDLEGAGREVTEGESGLDGRQAFAAEPRDPLPGPLRAV